MSKAFRLGGHIETDKHTNTFKKQDSQVEKLTKTVMVKVCYSFSMFCLFFSHLLDINALDLLPLTKWFNCCFAGVLDESSLAKYVLSYI